MSQMENLPQNIFEEWENLSQENLSKEKLHSGLCSFSEKLLRLLTGISIGEYLNLREPDDDIDKKMHDISKKRPSMGEWVGLNRIIRKKIPEGILGDFWTNPTKPGLLLKHEFAQLKSYIEKSDHDVDFDKLDFKATFSENGAINRRACSVLELLDLIPEIRNVKAHPENKACGGKRDWPLTVHYFKFINPLLYNALKDILEVFCSKLIAFYEYNISNDGEKKWVLVSANKNIKPVTLEDNIVEVVIKDQVIFDLEKKSPTRVFSSRIPPVAPQALERLDNELKKNSGRELLMTMAKFHGDRPIDPNFIGYIKEAFALGEDDVRKCLESLKDKTCAKDPNIGSGQRFIEDPEMFKSMEHSMQYFDKWFESREKKDKAEFMKEQEQVWNKLNIFVKRIFLNLICENERSNIQWSHAPNKTAMGTPAGHYWSKMIPENASIGSAFNIGFFLRRRDHRKSVWLKKFTNDTPDYQTRHFLWLCPDTKNIDKYDSDQKQLLIGHYKDILNKLLSGDFKRDDCHDKILIWKGKSYSRVIDNAKSYQQENLKEDEFPCILSKFYTIKDIESDKMGCIHKLQSYMLFCSKILYDLNNDIANDPSWRPKLDSNNA